MFNNNDMEVPMQPNLPKWNCLPLDESDEQFNEYFRRIVNNTTLTHVYETGK